MPIFEYVCQVCGARFEKLVLGSRSVQIRCPQCGAEKAEKAISRFSAGGSAGAARSGDANCAPGGG